MSGFIEPITKELPLEYAIEMNKLVQLQMEGSVVQDHPQRLDEMPRTNKWSLEQNLWRLLKQARKGVARVPNCIDYFTDCGKECVGLASEIYALFEYSALEQD